MAKFEAQLPTDILKDVDFLAKNAVEIFGGMTKAGAEVAAENMKQRARKALKSNIAGAVANKIKVTKTYETKKREIATAARAYGYVPKKDGKPFVLKKNGKTYTYNQGVPAPLLLNLADQGKSIASTMVPQFRDYWMGIKYPIVIPAFADTQGIEAAMLKAQEKLSGGLLKND